MGHSLASWDVKERLGSPISAVHGYDEDMSTDERATEERTDAQASGMASSPPAPSGPIVAAPAAPVAAKDAQMTLDEFRVGDRIETHPATDRWMRGDRFGTVTRVGRKYLSIDMDRSGQRIMLRARDIVAVIS